MGLFGQTADPAKAEARLKALESAEQTILRVASEMERWKAAEGPSQEVEKLRASLRQLEDRLHDTLVDLKASQETVKWLREQVKDYEEMDAAGVNERTKLRAEIDAALGMTPEQRHEAAKALGVQGAGLAGATRLLLHYYKTGSKP